MDGTYTTMIGVVAPACVVESAVPELVDPQLFPEERSYIEKAVPKRRAEFGTARVCARRALARLGMPPVPLVPHQDRSPRWPDGVVGSITHTQGYCAVAVARSSELLSVGIDAEVDKVISPELVPMVCTPQERRRAHDHDIVVYFAAKEAFYKCQYPLTGQFLDFQDVELDLDPAQRTFRARVLVRLANAPTALSVVEGRYVRAQGLVVCGMSLLARSAR